MDTYHFGEVERIAVGGLAYRINPVVLAEMREACDYLEYALQYAFAIRSSSLGILASPLLTVDAARRHLERARRAELLIVVG